MDKTRAVAQKCLMSELVFSFCALKKCVKAQSNPIILSKVIVLKDDDDDRQTDTVLKTIISCLKGLKMSRFYENLKSYFSPNTNTFSYDENVKNRKKYVKEIVNKY